MAHHRALALLAVLAVACTLVACNPAQRPAGGRAASGAATTTRATGGMQPPSAAPASQSPAAVSAPSSAAAATAPTARPARWAQLLERPGLPNLHRVSADYYRSAQPTAEGMAALAKLGVRTVINLRATHSDRALLAGLSLRYQHISMKAWHAEHQDAVRLLALVTDPANLPVLVHCKHGADRTGLMTAIYRVAVQGWSKADAIAEMTEGGFGYHPSWKNLVRFLQDLDVPALRQQVGLPPR